MSRTLLVAVVCVAGFALAGNLQTNVVQEAESWVIAWDAISIELPKGENNGGDSSPILLIEGGGIIHALVTPNNPVSFNPELHELHEHRFTLSDGHPDEGGRILRWAMADERRPYENVRFYDGLWVWPDESNDPRTELTVTYRRLPSP